MGRRVTKLLTLLAAVTLCLGAMHAVALANPLGIPDQEYNALVALYVSTDGANWTNDTNWLTESPDWYGVVVQYGHVTSIDLSVNNLSGAIPPGLGDLTGLYWLNLSGNRLTGDIPPSVTAMTMLNWLDLGYNALSCSDPAVLSFLAAVDPYWQYTQTAPPTNVSAWRGGGSADVMWTPAEYSSDQGYYEVGYSYTAGGPYTFDPANRTEGKWSESLWIDGLDPNQPVYLVVRTVTLPHYNNPSTLASENSAELAPPILPPGSKLAPDGAGVWADDVVITAAFADCCYAENEARTWGIRVESPYGGYPDPGTKARAFGTMRTNEDGERYLEVINGDDTGLSQITPLGMTNRALGGGNYNYDPGTGAGQTGVTGGAGLNNIGLLVRTTGACTYIDDRTFTIDDGSGVSVTCITPSTILANPAWQQAAVTGISSIKRIGDTYGRVLRVTGVDALSSAPPEGITGRWEMTNASGDPVGVYGMLLVQRGDTVTGTCRGLEIVDGRTDGNVFTASFLPDESMTILSSMILDGDTLTGAWATPGGEWSSQVTFHRVSADPVSPYVGRPKVVSATCNGWAIDVTWDRPINGWDYDIRDGRGESIADWSDTVNRYFPATNKLRMPLRTLTPMVPGERYTIYLESGDSVDWHDPYGAAAWDSEWDCYSFEYTYQTPPPAPSVALGFHAFGMPEQWVTITASWPQGYGLKLYQSSDMVDWHPTTIAPIRRGGSGDFTFELWSNAYFMVTTVGDSGESYPSPKVHARPFEIENGGIVIDAPAERATGVPLAPLMSWHPAWTQTVTLQRYAPKVIDVATGNVLWSPLTAGTPPQTSLIYGQTSGVMTMPAIPLSASTTYALRLGAFDSENWMFATAPERRFTTTAESGGPADEDAIRALYQSIANAIEAHDIDATMALFSQDYVHNGTDRATQHSYMREGIAQVTSVTYDITGISVTGNKASVTASITVTLDGQPTISWTEPSSSEDGLGMGWLIQENGQWLVYGNQQRGNVGVNSIREPDGSYTFRANARGLGLASATVSGPGIEPTALNWDSNWSDFNGSIAPSPAPEVGYIYTFDLYYSDGRHETLTDTITSLVPAGPTLTAMAQPDNTIRLTWEDVTALVPGASYYQVYIQGQNGSSYAWSSSDINLSTTSLTTEALQPGATYWCGLCLYNVYGDGAEYGLSVTIPSGDDPPPPPF